MMIKKEHFAFLFFKIMNTLLYALILFVGAIVTNFLILFFLLATSMIDPKTPARLICHMTDNPVLCVAFEPQTTIQ